MMTEKLRASKGCEGVSPQPLHKIGDDVAFSTCVGNFFSPSALSLLEMHKSYERGVMPFPGALVDQPAKVMDVFRTIESHRAERMIEAEKKRKLMERTKRRG